MKNIFLVPTGNKMSTYIFVYTYNFQFALIKTDKKKSRMTYLKECSQIYL